MISKLIFLIFLYLLYRSVKSWYLNNFPDKSAEKGNAYKEVPADLMVQDPCCKVYFPRREGFRLEAEGRDLYFCSEACRDKYLLTLKQKKQE